MSTDLTFAGEAVFQDVKQLFADEGATASVIFGRREPTKQINQGTGRANRVVFVPGVAGKLGSYSAARNPNRNPRPLATLLENFTVYCWGYDGANPRDELLQYKAVHLVHDQVIRAIYLSSRSGHGTVEWTDPQVVNDEKVELRFGMEWQFTLTVQSMIPDTSWPETDPLHDPMQGVIANKMIFPDQEVLDGVEIVTG